MLCSSRNSVTQRTFMERRIILMGDPIVEQLEIFSADVHLQLLKDCYVIFAVNYLRGRTNALINHPSTVEKHHQDLPSLLLLQNFLMFLLPFLRPSLTFMFEIVVVNSQFVNSDHSLTIPVIQILKFLRVLLGLLEMKFYWFLCEQELMWNTHVSL